MAQLHSTLRNDWPAFLKVVTDEKGVLLALFNAERLSSERRADLREYMNRLQNTHPTAAEFGLNRDPTRWGAVLPGVPAAAGVEGVDDQVVYALRPPW